MKPYGLSEKEWKAIVLARDAGWWRYAVSGNYAKTVLLAVFLSLSFFSNSPQEGGTSRLVSWIFTFLFFVAVTVVIRVTFRIADYFIWRRPLVRQCEKNNWFAKTK